MPSSFLSFSRSFVLIYISQAFSKTEPTIMFGTCIERVLRFFGRTHDEIYRARLWWSNLLVRTLPAAVYSRTREFINWYENECQTLHATLQRMRQLNREDGEEIYMYNLHPDIPSKSVSPYKERRIQNLRRLRSKLLNIQAQLNKSSDRAPDDAAMWIRNKFWRARLYEDGRSNFWNHRRQGCANRGGCCARTCGCCEKALDEYWTRDYSGARGPKGTMFLMKVYGHCSSECACCVITHGVYVPDSRLPSPDFVAGGRSSS